MMVAACWPAAWIFAGAVLEVLGIVGIAVGIVRTRRRFSERLGIVGTAMESAHRGAAASLRGVRAAIARLRGRESVDATVTPNAIGIRATITPSGTVTTRVWPADNEGRIEELLRRVEANRDEIAKAKAEHADALEAQNDALAAEEAARAASDEELIDKLRDLASGSLRLEAWSAFFLLAGVVMTAIGSLCAVGQL